MKRKSKNQQIKKKKEFRFHNIELNNINGVKTKIRHPTYVFLEKGNIYIYISITHSSSVENKIVIKLRKNPNPKDNKDSYWVVDVKEDTKDTFSKRQKEWSMDDEDDADIRAEYKKR